MAGVDQTSRATPSPAPTAPNAPSGASPAAAANPAASATQGAVSQIAAALPAVGQAVGATLTGQAWQPGTQLLPDNRRSFKLWGDPHAVAGDGRKFDNEQVGTITQLRSASGDFELQTTQNRLPGKKNVTYNTSAAVKAGSDVVSFDATRNALVVNHKPIELPKGGNVSLPGGGQLSRDDKGNIQITSPKGDKVELHVAHTKHGDAPYLNISGQLGASRTDGEVRGALGAFHAGDAANADFVGRDGQTYDAQYGHGDNKSLTSNDTYNKANVDAFEKSWMVQGKGLLQENQGKGTDTAKWREDAAKVDKQQAASSHSQLGLPSSGRKGGPLSGSASKDGNNLPATSGRATTFWNGAYSYKGQHDTENMSGGAWGDPNKPTEYICALPVGLNGGGDWWHNQKILVTNPSNGRQVVVRIQDKGPAPSTGNAIDLSPVAKEALGVNFMDNLDVHIAFAPDGAPVGPVH